ncbi:MAG: hypothetical protein AAFQ80_00510 [Cyanobacteria bacterium J06621_8]
MLYASLTLEKLFRPAIASVNLATSVSFNFAWYFQIVANTVVKIPHNIFNS